MPKGTPIDASRYDRLLEAIEQSTEKRLHCSEVACILGCDGRNVSARMSWALEHGIAHRITEGRSTYYARGPNPDAPRDRANLGDFNPALWGDGELALHGLPAPSDETGSVILNSAQRLLLRRLLTGEL